jgi:hypothetical protein
VVDWGGKVAAWFAGVAGVSAGLAALLVGAAKEPLHGWMEALFVALVIIAAVSFIALLLTGPAPRGRRWAAGNAPSRLLLLRSSQPSGKLNLSRVQRSGRKRSVA